MELLLVIAVIALLAGPLSMKNSRRRRREAKKSSLVINDITGEINTKSYFEAKKMDKTPMSLEIKINVRVRTVFDAVSEIGVVPFLFRLKWKTTCKSLIYRLLTLKESG